MTHQSHTIRLHAAFLTACAGGSVAQSMILWGESLARFLPPLPVLCIAAVFGAAVAGSICAGAFGRRGVRGWVLMACMWPAITALGAGIAVMPMGVMEFSPHTSAAVQAVVEAAALGWLAVADGILTSLPVTVVWLLSGAMIHMALRQQRSVTT